MPGYEPPPATPEGWQLTGARGGDISEKGWNVELTEPGAIATTPPVAIEARIAPQLRLNWWADGHRLDDHQTRAPARPEPGQPDPEDTVARPKPGALQRYLENGQLLAQGEVFGGERCTREKERAQEGNDQLYCTHQAVSVRAL